MFSPVHVVPSKHQRADSEMGLLRCTDAVRGSFKCPYKKKQEATVPFSPMETQQVAGSHRQTTDVLALSSGSFQLQRVWATAETQTVIFCYNHRQSKTHLPVTTESRRGKNLYSEIRQNAMLLEKFHQDTPESLMRWQEESFGYKKKKQTDVWL